MAFKSSKGRDVGKGVKTFQSSEIGQGVGGGGGGSAAAVTVSGSGGTKTVFSDYTVHEFKSSGTFSISSGEGHINLLLVAGGGGGAPNRGGGGGAGGVLHRCHIEVDPTTSPFAVTIGGGGSAVNSNPGAYGTNSTFGPTFTAYASGSTRGGGQAGVEVGGAPAPAPLLPQGNPGGPGGDPAGGGGGGAGRSGTSGGVGGSGIIIPQIPTAYGDSGFFGGGGAGGNHGSRSGGAGGGGDVVPGTGSPGAANTGGGGGGAPDPGSAGSGGSGICIVYYQN